MNYKLLAAVVVAVAGMPGVASAATIGVEPDGIHYQAALGEVNALSMVQETATTMSFTDSSAPLTPGSGCTAGPPVTCDRGRVFVALGDRNDVASVNMFTTSATMDGGSGNDDFLVGGLSATGTGGNGDDTIRLASNDVATGSGGMGADSIAGGFGSYADDLSGGSGSDLLVLTGTPGPSTARGEDGVDRIVAVGGGRTPATADGGNGTDTLIGPKDGRAITLNGGASLDRIQSRAGNTTIDAGSGMDLVDAAHGGSPDTVVCGSGFDVVFADADDEVAADCEWRFDYAAPTGLGFESAVAAADALVAHTPSLPTAGSASAQG